MSVIAKRITIALCVILGTCFILALYLPGLRPMPKPAVITSGEPQIGGAFTLINGKGETVTQDVLKGHYSLVYFGYTQCPDVCPLALQTMTDALLIAGPVAETVVPVFISVDPEHDTPEVMNDYVAHFHPRFVTLTGTPEQIAVATKDYRVYAAKQTGAKPSDYSMAHSDFVYLMGPDGKYVTHFRSEVSATDIANRVRRALGPRNG